MLVYQLSVNFVFLDLATMKLELKKLEPSKLYSLSFNFSFHSMDIL